MIHDNVQAVVFDKDGTLVDFERTHTPALHIVLSEMSHDDSGLFRQAAAIVGYDIERRMVEPGAPAMSVSNAQMLDSLAPVFGHSVGDQGAIDAFESRLAELVVESVVEVDGASAVVDALAAKGIRLGLATNDGEASTRLQLAALGWSDKFDSVHGYDSGHGAKPDPGMVLASLAAMGVAAHEAVMVGDSHADLAAARAAGVVAVYVGTDPELARWADAVITIIGELVDQI